jgi:enoyl-CoA hydratase/carnithine racemase
MSDGEPAKVRCALRGAAAWVTIERPEASNALDRAVVAGLRRSIAQASGDAAVRALVLAGAGERAFCAGADLKERRGMTRAETERFLDDLNALMNEVEAAGKLVIAAIGGVAFGGGTELALACDLRVASERAELGLTEVRLGIMPGAGGSFRLARLVGAARAKELILLGRRISARRALELGLVSQVVAPEGLVAAVDALVEEVSGSAPLSVAMAKAAIDGAWGLSPEAALALERRCYERTLVSEDREEGLRAFAEKRKPVFQGR